MPHSMLKVDTQLVEDAIRLLPRGVRVVNKVNTETHVILVIESADLPPEWHSVTMIIEEKPLERTVRLVKA